MTLSKLAAAFAITFSMLACSGKSAPREELAEVAKAKDAACACTDHACALAARTTLDAAMDRLQKRPKKVDSELTNQMLSLVTDAAMCLAKYQ